MKCRQNDVAVVIRDSLGEHYGGQSCIATQIGAMVTLTVEAPYEGHGPAWFYRGERLRCLHCDRPILSLLDADLQPMRPRGAATPTRRDRRLTEGAEA
jgi:hypothetical protein